MSRHVHSPCRLSTPHVDLCECGAILVIGRTEWIESTWDPLPLPPPPPPPPPPRPPPVTERPTDRLPLVLVQALELGGWCVR